MMQDRTQEILVSEVREAREFIEKIRSENARHCEATIRMCLTALRLTGEARLWIVMRLKIRYARTLLDYAASAWQQYLHTEKDSIAQMARRGELEHVSWMLDLCEKMESLSPQPLYSFEEVDHLNEGQRGTLSYVGNHILKSQYYMEFLYQKEEPAKPGCHWNIVICARDNQTIDLGDVDKPLTLRDRAKILLARFNKSREGGTHDLAREINIIEEKLNIEKAIFLLLKEKFLGR